MTDIRALAEKRFGKPSHATKLELRFGRKGSVKVRLADGVWVDYETGQGGRLRADDAAPAPRKTRAQIEQDERAERHRGRTPLHLLPDQGRERIRARRLAKRSLTQFA